MENKEKTIWGEIRERVCYPNLGCRIKIKNDIVSIVEYRNRDSIGCGIYINGEARGIWMNSEYKDSHHPYIFDMGKGGREMYAVVFPSLKRLIKEYKKRFKESEIEIID